MKEKKLWILVKVERGLASSMTLFKNRKNASAEQRRVLRTLNPDYDDVRLFEFDAREIASREQITVEL